MSGWSLTSPRDEKSFYFFADYIFSRRHRKQQSIPAVNISFKPALLASQVTGAQFFYRPTITKCLKVSLSLCALSLSPPASFQCIQIQLMPKTLLYQIRRGWFTVISCWNFADVRVRCESKKKKKSRRKDILNASRSLHIWKGKVFLLKHLCGYRAASTKGNKTLSCLCIISDIFFLS